jgi:transposase
MGMVMNNPVLVTALYDIGRDKWDKFTQSYNGYLDWMKNILSLDCNIVIYTESKFADKIVAIRKTIDIDLTKTKLIIQELNELQSYKLYYKRLNELMFSDDFQKKISFKDVPEMSKPLYNVIMFNKVNWLKNTVEKRFFNNDFVIWSDAGGLRENTTKYKNIKWPNIQKINNLDNDKITFFSHTKNINITDNEYHSLSQIRNIQGTCFFVQSKNIDFLSDKFDETVNESINLGYIGSDEKILDITYQKNINNYHLIQCSWREYFDLFV